MNLDDDLKRTERMAAAWNVQTQDLSARVASAIGATPTTDLAEILGELRLMRDELRRLHAAQFGLQEELFRLRLELSRRPSTRLAPYAPTESLSRLS